MVFGASDLSITGYLSDLPAIVHHADVPVSAHLEMTSNKLDLSEITNYSKTDSAGIDEIIKELKLGLSFNTSAREFTESKNLPEGEFFVDNCMQHLKIIRMNYMIFISTSSLEKEI